MAVGQRPEWVREASKGVDSASLSEEINRARTDGRWIEENRESLRASYSGKFIAVHDKKVVATGNSIGELHQAVSRTGVHPRECVTEFVLAEEFIWIV